MNSVGKSLARSDRKNAINSLCLAIFISANALTALLPKVENIIVYVLVLITIVGFLNNGMAGYSGKVLPIILIVVIEFIVSVIKLGFSQILVLYFLSFVTYAGCALYFVDKPFNKHNFYVFSNIFFLISFCFYYSTNFSLYDYGAWMGISYALMPGAILAFLQLVDRSYSIITKVIAGLIIYIFIQKIVPFSSRGVIISIGFFTTFYFTNKITKNNFLKLVLILFFCICITMLYIHIYEILIFVKEHLIKWNYAVFSIDKALMLIHSDDLSNGRFDLYSSALKMFHDSWLFGNGIGSFELAYNEYPHNLFLQILVEGGIFLLVPIVIILAYGLKKCVNNKDSSQALFILFIYSITIPRLLFSSTLWLEQKVWFLFGYLMYIYLNNKTIVLK